MKQIDANNKIFKSEEFLKDKYKYNVVFKILKSPELKLYSDEKNYFICQGEKNRPIWIWTKDNIDAKIVLEIEEAIEIYLTDDIENKFTCKKELYDLLKTSNFKYLSNYYFEMGFLSCKETKKPKSCNGQIDLANESDRETLINYWYNDCKEMYDKNSIDRKQAIKDVEEFLKSGNFYVWRVNNKIVSMAIYNIIDNQAKISHVYTPPEERNQGYASNLIYQITNDVLNKNLVPLLYTNYNYSPSNKAYQNAGYEDRGILIIFSCAKKVH